MINSYRDLIVWQKAIELVVEIYSITNLLPKTELYKLTDQICRAATSIPANIAEGYARVHKKEYIQFLRIAFSSGAELETHLIITEKLNFLTSNRLEKAWGLLSEVMKMLRKLIQSLEQAP